MTEPEKIRDPILVTAREHLEEVAADIHRTGRVAVDIESNSFYVYRERTCLVQISTVDADYIVDPLAVKDLSSLGPMFADPATQIVFHAGEYDVVCLKRDYSFTFAHLFDTMIASRLLGFKELGLAAAIERHFGVKLSKKLQRADWGRRPLSEAHIRYAQLDTHYLLRLCDIQTGLLREKKLEADAAEAFAKLARSTPVEKVFDPNGFWRLARGLSPDGRQLAVLKELYLLREREAESRNRATFRVMPDEVLPRLAMTLPRDSASLRGVRGMTPYLLDNYGSAVLAAVRRGLAAPPIDPDSREKPEKKRDPRAGRLFEKLRLWRKSKGQQLNVDPVDLIPTTDLKTIARLTIAGSRDPLGPLSLLKRSRFGAEILKLARGS
ncbi:MAG: HRDC domain-containing protein [Elusimicrobia bacterium]|nr:HRDC domain-containing protein [Elusimicrobiota bacterium]